MCHQTDTSRRKAFRLYSEWTTPMLRSAYSARCRKTAESRRHFRKRSERADSVLWWTSSEYRGRSTVKGPSSRHRSESAIRVARFLGGPISSGFPAATVSNTGRSFNGRTRFSGPRYRGSNPWLPANPFEEPERLVDQDIVRSCPGLLPARQGASHSPDSTNVNVVTGCCDRREFESQRGSQRSRSATHR